MRGKNSNVFFGIFAGIRKSIDKAAQNRYNNSKLFDKVGIAMTLRSLRASLSQSARRAVCASFSFLFAVRYFAYCIFYYALNRIDPQRTHGMAAL